MQPIVLSSGIASFPAPAPAAEAAVRVFSAEASPPLPTEGLLSFRQAIADRYQEENQVEVSEEGILVTPGVRQAVYNVLACLLRPGDEVILPTPYWGAFQEMVEQAGGKVVPLATVPEENYTLHPEALERLITPRTRLFLFCNPHNPTGRIYTLQEMEALGQVLRRQPQVYVLSDEIYDFITFDGRVPSWLELLPDRDRLFLVNGFSKSFALTAWRVGYLIPPAHYYNMCLRYQDVTLSGLNPFVQEGAAAALTHRFKILPSRLETLARHRTLLTKALRLLPVRYQLPAGAYYVFVDFSPLIRMQQPSWSPVSGSEDFFRRLRAEAGLEVRPGDSFQAPGFGRVSFAVQTDQLEEAIGRLKRYCEKWLLQPQPRKG